jgi:hypothetical protein
LTLTVGLRSASVSRNDASRSRSAAAASLIGARSGNCVVACRVKDASDAGSIVRSTAATCAAKTPGGASVSSPSESVSRRS